MPTKIIFAYYFFEGTFASVFRDKKSVRGHKTEEIKVCLTISAV
jgi:hypothetical protein